MQKRSLKALSFGLFKLFLAELILSFGFFIGSVAANEKSYLDLVLHKGCSLEHTQRQYLQTGVYRIYQAYLSLGQTLPAQQSLKTHLFCTIPSFVGYRKLKESNAYSLSGYYSRRYQELVINASYGNDRAIRTVFHESSHHFFNQLYSEPPQWLNEGLGEYFENSKPTLQGLEVSPQKHKAKRLLDLLDQQDLPLLKSLFALNSSHWQAWNRKDLRASSMSWGLIYFLMDQPSGRSLVGALISNRQGFTYAEDLLNYKYPGGEKKLELDWHVWLRKGHKNHVWVLPSKTK